MKKSWRSLACVGTALSVLGAVGILGPAATAATATVATSSQAWAVQYTGGTAGAAKSSESPLTVGVIEPVGAQAGAYPGGPAIVKAAGSYVNDQLGGVGGHPIKLSICDVTDSQDAQTCGEQFANNPKIGIVVNGDLVIDDTAELSALASASVPVILPLDITSGELGATNAANYGPSLTNFYPAFAEYLVQQGDAQKSISVLLPNNTAGVGTEGLLKQDFAADHITNVAYTPIPLDGTAPQYTSAIQAVNGAHASVVFDLADDVACVDGQEALKTLGASANQPFLATSGCMDSLAFSHYSGHLPSNWRIFNFGNSPLVPGVATGVDSYVAAMKKFAPGVNPSVPTSSQFASIITADKLLNQVGFSHVTRSSMMQAMKAFTGPAMMEPGTFKCGYQKSSPSVCGNTVAIDRWAGSKWVESIVKVGTL
jgi:branched-chain amino acid transport system substrate-binding protein